MTTPNGPVLFNNSTGSDTQASGLGPATAVFGSGASTTGSAVVTGIDTTGVTAGDLLWVQSSSGRQFSIIASVDSGSQVTCDDTFANTESGRTWAIGGKRSSLNADSQLIFSSTSSFSGCVVEIEHTGSDYTFDNAYLVWSQSRLTVKGTGGVPVLKNTVQGFTGFQLNSNNGRYERLVFERNRNANTNNNEAVRLGAGIHVFVDCEIRQVGPQERQNAAHCVMYNTNSNDYKIKFYGCKITGGESGLFKNSGAEGVGCDLINCVIENNNIGVDTRGISGLIEGCRICNNVSHGVRFTQPTLTNKVVSGCVFYNNGGSGIVNGDDEMLVVINNIFSENGAYGIDCEPDKLIAGGNAFFSNTSGEVSSTITRIRDDITLTADPFVDAANGDFNLNDTAGGGALLRSATFDLP